MSKYESIQNIETNVNIIVRINTENKKLWRMY